MRKLAIFATLSLAFAAACGDDSATPKDAAVVHDAPTDGGTGADASCFNDPHTNNEIINACTTAQKIYVNDRPALQLPDGGLPPLP
jgi:hypothetical protein